MLTAKTEEGKLVVLTPELERERLRKWRKLRSFFCPQCNFPVQLKVGDIIIPHFAHLKDSTCLTLFSEGESYSHLQGKQQLYAFFQKHAELVELEPFLRMLSQRPDILITTQSESLAVEFQCSTIPITDVEARSAGYRSIDMKPIWILHTPAKFSSLPVGVGTFDFSRFHESFLTHTSPEGYFLLTYNPQTERFHYFTSLIHVAGKRYIGIHRTLPLSMQIFPFARPKTPTEREIYRYVTLYLSIRNQFIQSRILLNKRGVNNPFLRMCYELRVIPTSLPKWIGVPVLFGESFREHDCEWQLAFLYYLRRKGISVRTISRSQVRKYVSRLEEPSEEKGKACIAYRDFLISVTVDSCQNRTVIDEEKIIQLISERLLAKRYEN
ncbi:competence protein CoiA family protein [Sporosarcina sp. FSL K6-6792]|uniref:competence protein CoiA n=1 Tax=Sporosarcina sp. FSL K6-6792 TaxID=2921559 RepID=UPI0030F66FF2